MQFCDKNLNILTKHNNGFHLGTLILQMVQGNRKEKQVERNQSFKLDSPLNPYLILELHFDFMWVYRVRDMKNDNKLGSLDWTVIQNALGRRW